MNLNRIKRWGLVSAVVAAGALAASAASAETLRICSDPDNLPFSKEAGDTHGLYIDVANLVAQKLDAEPEYVWWLSLNQRKALRNTILDGKCDAYFALPADAEYGTRGLARTQPFLDVSYAIVAPPRFKFTGLEDLKGKRIGVEFESTPQIMLAAAGDYDTVTYRRQEEILDGLDKDEIDVAFMWGPTAGYGNISQYGKRWRVTPVSGSHMDHQVAVAVPEAKTDLLKRIDEALVELKPQIASLAKEYGFPQGKAVSIAKADTDGDSAADSDKKEEGAEAGNDEQMAQAGRKTFNTTCSHCHSPDGASPVRRRDLRRLEGKYRADWKETARTTIVNGREDLGMPAWKDGLSEQEIDEVMAFLETIQN